MRGTEPATGKCEKCGDQLLSIPGRNHEDSRRVVCPVCVTNNYEDLVARVAAGIGSEMQDCPNCRGNGWVYALSTMDIEVECQRCLGSGRVDKSPREEVENLPKGKTT